jgi:hypothetical protein
MKDQLDQRIHQLVTEVHDAAPVPPPLELIAPQPTGATAGSRRPILAAAMVVISGVVALGAVVVLRRDITENPAATVVESSVPSTEPVATTAPPTSVAEGRVGFEIESEADGVAITEVDVDNQRCLRIAGVETPAAASSILTCENDVQPAGGPLARPGVLAPQREEGTGRLVFVGLHDPGVATILLRVDDGTLPLHRQVIEPTLWAPGDIAVALVALPAEVSQNASSFTTELYDNDGTVVSVGGGTIPAD